MTNLPPLEYSPEPHVILKYLEIMPTTSFHDSGFRYFNVTGYTETDEIDFVNKCDILNSHFALGFHYTAGGRLQIFGRNAPLKRSINVIPGGAALTIHNDGFVS